MSLKTRNYGFLLKTQYQDVIQRLQSPTASPGRLGEQLGSGQSAVPVVLYGSAAGDGRTLAQLRRSLGYFAGSSAGQGRAECDCGWMGVGVLWEQSGVVIGFWMERSIVRQKNALC